MHRDGPGILDDQQLDPLRIDPVVETGTSRSASRLISRRTADGSLSGSKAASVTRAAGGQGEVHRRHHARSRAQRIHRPGAHPYPMAHAHQGHLHLVASKVTPSTPASRVDTIPMCMAAIYRPAAKRADAVNGAWAPVPLRPHESVPELRRGESGPCAVLPELWHRPRGHRTFHRGSQDRHGAVCGCRWLPQLVSRRTRVDPAHAVALLRRHAPRYRAPRRHRGEVHRRCRHGGVRHPNTARG